MGANTVDLGGPNWERTFARSQTRRWSTWRVILDLRPNILGWFVIIFGAGVAVGRLMPG